MSDMRDQMQEWRYTFHRNPELSMQEKNTAAYIAEELRSMGIEVHEGIGGTGVVGVLRSGDGGMSVGLRADMDAIPVTEKNDLPYRSANDGAMHACGHDGHMAVLLGAAKELSSKRDFNGTVYFIFQPGEETGRGAQAMLDDGLLEKFPIDEIYGFHNMPQIPEGKVATRPGGIMASEDNFVITIKGVGGHAAQPHKGKDPLVIAAEVILGIQTIVSRSIDPACSSVISLTEITSDGVHNVIPSTVTIKGDTRSLDPVSQKTVETRMRDICEGVCRMNGAECDFEFTYEFIPTVNHKEYVPYVAEAAAKVVGPENVDSSCVAPLTSEDFGRFVREIPGCFFFIGTGRSDDDPALHNSSYDFDDNILEIGKDIFVQLVHDRLK